MKISEGPLPGCFVVRLRRLGDTRGCFVKTFARSVYASAGVEIDMLEEYYSVSHKGVIRGMHFQLPPYDHNKVVYCASGAVADVLLELRRGASYGKSFAITLSADDPALLIIPKGVAHGFEALTDDSLMVYKASTEYVPECDRGIRWDSFGHEWSAEKAILSDRDRAHPAFADFCSPF